MKPRPRIGAFCCRVCLAAAVTAGFAWVSVSVGGPPASQPIDVGSRKQLFIDRKFVAAEENITLVVNPPAKLPEAVIRSDKPWDAFRLIWFSVGEDEDGYKMWYQAFDNDQWSGGRSRMCYATSKDLIHWEKPNLGIIEFEGSKENNIIIEDIVNGSVFIDPHADPAERYKLVYTDHRAGWKDIYVVASADGIHWEMPGTKVAEHGADTQHAPFWDPRLQKYVVYMRASGDHPFVDPIESDPPVVAPKLIRPGRQLARIEVDDILQPWPTEQIRRVMTADEHDPEGSDIYHHHPWQYPFADDAYFLFPLTYHHFRSGETTAGNDGVNDTQFAASRNGVNWIRYDRRPYVGRGLPGEPDCGMVQCGSGRHFRRGDYLYQFCAGWPWTHGGFRRLSQADRQDKEVSWGRQHYYLVRQRLDGFVSADAPYGGGYLVTPPIVFQGTRLELNINVAAMGEARVEIQEPDGKPSPGFELDSCRRILFNDTAYTVRWGDSSDVASLAGKPIRLKIWMRSAKLYAFQFASQD